MLALVGVAVVAVRPELVTDNLPDGGESDVAPLAQETARPTAAPSGDAFPDRPTLKDPFRGSPAVRWADGAAGIVPPEAKAVGGMSKEQVAHALRSTKEVLVAANLDPATLRGSGRKRRWSCWTRCRRAGAAGWRRRCASRVSARTRWSCSAASTRAMCGS